MQVTQVEVVRQEAVHAVHGDESLRDGIRSTVVGSPREPDSVAHLATEEVGEKPILTTLFTQAVPASPHADSDRAVVEDGRRPFDCVYFRDDRGSDEPCMGK